MTFTTQVGIHVVDLTYIQRKNLQITVMVD